MERLGVRPSRLDVIKSRAVKVLMPVLLGGLVDFGDLITSPILAPIFLPLGMLVGYLFAKWLDAPPTWRCLLYTSPSPRDQRGSRMPSSA